MTQIDHVHQTWNTENIVIHRNSCTFDAVWEQRYFVYTSSGLIKKQTFQVSSSVWSRPLSVVESVEDDFLVIDDEKYESVEVKCKMRAVVTECNIVLCLLAIFGLLILFVKNIWIV